MSKVISGKELSIKLKAEMAARVATFPEKYGRVPHLVVILVGEDPASQSYVRGKAKASEVVGIRNTTILKPADITEAELLTGEKLPVSGEYKNEALKKLDCILCRFVTSYDRTCYNLIRNGSLICKIFKFSLRFRDPIYSGISGCYNPLKYFDIQIICKKGG